MIVAIAFGIIAGLATGNWLVALGVAVGYTILAFMVTPRDSY